MEKTVSEQPAADHTIISIPEAVKTPLPKKRRAPRLPLFLRRRRETRDEGKLQQFYMVCIIVMYPALATLLQSRYQNAESPFMTHTKLMRTSVVSYFIAVSAAVVARFMKSRAITKLGKAVYTFLVGVALVSISIAPLALAILLF